MKWMLTSVIAEHWLDDRKLSEFDQKNLSDLSRAMNLGQFLKMYILGRDAHGNVNSYNVHVQKGGYVQPPE